MPFSTETQSKLRQPAFIGSNASALLIIRSKAHVGSSETPGTSTIPIIASIVTFVNVDLLIVGIG